MKFRITLGLFAFVAVMAFGFSALPGQAHAATPVTLSATDRSNLQAALDLTKMTLDAIQVQVDHNAIQDRASTLATLGGIKVYLLNVHTLLGGEPLALIEEPAPVAVPSSLAVAPRAPVTPAEPAEPAVAATPPGEVAGSATVGETTPQDQQAASVSTSTTSKRAFWIILITAVVIAIILAVPKKKTSVLKQDAPGPQPKPEAPEPPRPEEPEPMQSA